MAANTASGAKFFLGSASDSTTDTQVEFEADSYLEVGEVEDLGEFGDESEEVTFTALSDARVRKFKGPRNAGSITIVCADDPDDAGQDAMIAAEATTFDYNCKVELNDKASGETTPSTFYFRAKIMSKRLNVGNASNVVRRTFMAGINSAIVEVAPA